MAPPSVTFAAQEIIPGLRSGPGPGDPAFLQLEGNCPIIISAPHAANNLVSRKYMDLNRQWSNQQKWVGLDGTHRPGDETKSAGDFPRVAEFDAFRQSYYQDYHDTLRRFTTSQHPDGWLFDVHGTSLDGDDTLQIVTTRGFTARRDFVYDNRANRHRFLGDGGFKLDPELANPGNEAMAVNDDGIASMNLISGGRYGAHAPPADSAALPAPGPVTPGPQAHRVHGVQFELDGSIRHQQPPEVLESVGMNLAYAIFRCLLEQRPPAAHQRATTRTARGRGLRAPRLGRR